MAGFQISFLCIKLGSVFLQKSCHMWTCIFIRVSPIKCRVSILIVFVSAFSHSLLFFLVIFHALTILMYFWPCPNLITPCHYKPFVLIIQLMLNCMFYLSKKVISHLNLAICPHPQDSQHKANEGSNHRYITPAQQFMEGQLSCCTSRRS